MSVTLPLICIEMVKILKDQRSPKLEEGGGGVRRGYFGTQEVNWSLAILYAASSNHFVCVCVRRRRCTLCS